MRPAQEDGPGTVQAVHLLQARTLRHGDDDQGGQAHGGEGTSRGVGYLGRSDSRASGVSQPGADPPPARHPGLRAGPYRGQGDPTPPPGLHRVQRRLRRRPDGGPRAAIAGGPIGGPRADDVDQQHPQPGQRQADHRAVPGHRAGTLLSHHGSRGRSRRGHGFRRRRRDTTCPGRRHGDAALEGAGALHGDGRGR